MHQRRLLSSMLRTPVHPGKLMRCYTRPYLGKPLMSILRPTRTSSLKEGGNVTDTRITFDLVYFPFHARDREIIHVILRCKVWARDHGITHVMRSFKSLA